MVQASTTKVPHISTIGFPLNTRSTQKPLSGTKTSFFLLSRVPCQNIHRPTINAYKFLHEPREAYMGSNVYDMNPRGEYMVLNVYVIVVNLMNGPYVQRVNTYI